MTTPALTETSFEEFAARYNPEQQKKAVTHADNMVLGRYPTLTDSILKFGEGSTMEWLQAQLIDLSEFCGARDKLNARQIVQLCDRFMSKFSYLKVSEWLLFFGNLKDGKYGEFVGSIDPQRILARLQKDFMKDRSDIIDKEMTRQRDAERDKRREGTISYAEYCEMIGRNPSQNPIEAIMSMARS